MRPFAIELPNVLPINCQSHCRLCAALKPAFGEHAPPMERMAGSDLREMLQLPGLAAHPAVARALAASLDAGPAWPQVPPDFYSIQGLPLFCCRCCAERLCSGCCALCSSTTMPGGMCQSG
jgi:hypothetical protein